MPNGREMPYQYPEGAWAWQPVDKPAPHLGHSKHLCDMADKGADLETVKNLVRNAKFICKKCGRAAAKEENLCEPVPL